MLFTVIFGIAPLSLGLLIIICTACNHSRQRRAAQAAQAAAERAAAEKKHQAEQTRREKEAKKEHEKAARQEAAARKKQEAERKRQEREQRQAAAHAAKLARAAELAELAERRLQAEKELAQLRQQAAQQPEQRPQIIPATQAQERPAPAEKPAERPGISLDEFAARIAPQPFKGQTVSFTGKLYNPAGEHISREKAMALVKSLGGKAYKEMPAGTTLLVVGENPGMQKMDKADEWIGQVRKITPAQFWQMAGAAA